MPLDIPETVVATIQIIPLARNYFERKIGPIVYRSPVKSCLWFAHGCPHRELRYSAVRPRSGEAMTPAEGSAGLIGSRRKSQGRTGRKAEEERDDVSVNIMPFEHPAARVARDE
jgi:hypothetical protein